MQISISNAIGGDGGAQGSGNRPSFASTNSFTFDGNSDFIDCGDNDNLSFGNGTTDSAFSISAWVKMDSTSGFRIFNKYAATTNEYQFGTGGGNTLHFYLFDSTSTFIYRARSYNTILNTGQWYHVVATYNGVGGANAQNGIKLYVDGVRVDDTTASGGVYVAMGNKTTPVYIGRLDSSYADGNIDEVSLFNTALTDGGVSVGQPAGGQIAQVYNSGVPNDISSFNPISWWRMGEAATYTGRNWDLIDQGSGGNNGFSNTIPAPPAQPSTDVPS